MKSWLKLITEDILVEASSVWDTEGNENIGISCAQATICDKYFK